MNEHYCKGCLKFNEEDQTCLAFKELWPEWNKPGTECWSREENPKAMLDMLDIVDGYSQNGYNTQAPNGWRQEVKALKPKLQAMLNEQMNQDIHDVYMEDQKRGKGGGGEKNKDGSAFGPQELKDNRFVHRRMNKNDWGGWRK